MTLEVAAGGGNMHFVQLAFQGPFKLMLTYHGVEATPLNRKSCLFQ
jgi:hypothetical protein